MRRRSELPPDLASRPFSTQAAIDRGISRKRLRAPDLSAPLWGVRSVMPGQSGAGLSPMLSLEELTSAYEPRMPPHAFYSHLTAARLWGMPLPSTLPFDGTLDVAARIEHFAPSGHNLRTHRLRIHDCDVVTRAADCAILAGSVAVDGALRITSPARTLCDLSAILSERDLVAAGDFLLWWRTRPADQLTHSDLVNALARFSGRRGRPLLVATIPFLSDRSDSPPESIMRVIFRDAGLPAPAINHTIYDSSGRFVGMADLSWPQFFTAYDYEGDVHRTNRAQWRKDLKRAPRFEDAGWSYVRGGANDLADATELVSLIARRLRRNGWDGSVG